MDSTRHDSRKDEYKTKFWEDLEDSLDKKVTERNMFATLASVYGQEEFSSKQMSRNMKNTDETFWGTFGSLVNKGVYEKNSRGEYRLTEYGEELAEAVNIDYTIRTSATPEGYKTEGFWAKMILALEEDEEPEDLGFDSRGLTGYNME